MIKSIYETTCGRCGTHWVKHVIADALGLKTELPNVKEFTSAIGRLHGYVDEIVKKERENPGGNIYTYHAPLGVVKKLEGLVNVICLVRDPRDVVISSTYYAIKSGKIAMEDFRSHMSSRIRQKNKFFTKLMTSYLENDGYILRYEDLKKDTFGHLSGVFDFFRYEYDADHLKSMIQRYSFENMSGGRKIGEEDVTSHVRKGVVGDWKNYFSEEDNDIFIENHKSIMKGLGYL